MSHSSTFGHIELPNQSPAFKPIVAILSAFPAIYDMLLQCLLSKTHINWSLSDETLNLTINPNEVDIRIPNTEQTDQYYLELVPSGSNHPDLAALKPLVSLTVPIKPLQAQLLQDDPALRETSYNYRTKFHV